jgi:hypothetical protein
MITVRRTAEADAPALRAIAAAAHQHYVHQHYVHQHYVHQHYVPESAARPRR